MPETVVFESPTAIFESPAVTRAVVTPSPDGRALEFVAFPNAGEQFDQFEDVNLEGMPTIEEAHRAFGTGFVEINRDEEAPSTVAL